MNKTIYVFLFSIILFCKSLLAQESIAEKDSLKTLPLTVKDLKIIRSLTKEDTSLTKDLNSPLDVLTSGANYIYKKRLDSIENIVPLSYNAYVQSYIDIFVDKRTSHFSKMLGLGKFYFPVFERALKSYDIPEELKYLPIIESSLNPLAVSKSGATGLWQFMFTTAKMYGLQINNNIDERRDPVEASFAAAHYLSDAYKEFGDWLLVIASYNCGSGNVKRALQKIGGKGSFWDIYPYLPAQTQHYVPAYIAATYIMKNYKQHDIKALDANIYLNTDSIYVNKVISLVSLASKINLSTEDLIYLNPVYRKKYVYGSLENPMKLVIPVINNTQFEQLYLAINNTEEEELKFSKAATQAVENRKGVLHKVEKGETLEVISLLYGVEIQDIKVWNRLKFLNVSPGAYLSIYESKVIEAAPKKTSPSPKRYFTYKVKTGDTLSEIAESFNGVSINTIKTLNNLRSSVLNVGMILKVYAL